MLFCGDGTGIPSTWRGSIDEAVRWGVAWPRLDMSPWIAGLSRVTEHIGFGLTYATTFMHPFYVARLLNSLDHVTNGRIAFNVITSTRLADAANYGFDELMEHDRVMTVWKSSSTCARRCGTASNRTHSFGIAIRAWWQIPRRCTPSTTWAVFQGPRPPQHRAVEARAPGPPSSRRIAARHCGLRLFRRPRFRAGNRAKQKVAHRRDLDAALRARGRDPDAVGMLFGVVLIVAETEQEARPGASKCSPRSRAGGRGVSLAQGGLRFFNLAGSNSRPRS